MSTRLLVAFVAYTVIKHHGCKGRIYNKAFSISSNQIVQSEKLHGSRFGFEEGGTLSWNLSCVSVLTVASIDVKVKNVFGGCVM